MTAKVKDPTLAMRCPSPLVLFGIDSRGKPKGARFGKEHADLAIKAATQLQLKVLASNDPEVAEIAARLPVGRVARPAARSCRSFAATSTTSWSQPLRMEMPIPQTHRTAPQVRLVQPLAGRRPTCRKIGKPSALAIWSSQARVVRTAGTRPSSSSKTVTCSPYVGVTTRGNAGLCAIACGLDCSIPAPDQHQKMGNQRKPQATQSTTNKSQLI
jgi:hypothetical protein